MEAYFFKSPTGSPCLWMCVLFYFSFVCLHVCAYASKFKVHCGSAFEPGTSGLPHYCTPPACIPAVIRGLAVWQHNKKKNLLQVQKEWSQVVCSNADLFY